MKKQVLTLLLLSGCIVTAQSTYDRSQDTRVFNMITNVSAVNDAQQKAIANLQTQVNVLTAKNDLQVKSISALQGQLSGFLETQARLNTKLGGDITMATTLATQAGKKVKLYGMDDIYITKVTDTSYVIGLKKSLWLKHGPPPKKKK